jgi:hypothetical protein
VPLGSLRFSCISINIHPQLLVPPFILLLRLHPATSISFPQSQRHNHTIHLFCLLSGLIATRYPYLLPVLSLKYGESSILFVVIADIFFALRGQPTEANLNEVPAPCQSSPAFWAIGQTYNQNQPTATFIKASTRSSTVAFGRIKPIPNC